MYMIGGIMKNTLKFPRSHFNMRCLFTSRLSCRTRGDFFLIVQQFGLNKLQFDRLYLRKHEAA